MKKDDKVLVFRLGNEYFAVNATHISGIETFPKKVTKMPQTPEYYMGVSLIQNKPLPILNLALIFGISLDKNIQEKRIFQILAQDGQKSICAIMVDEVKEIRSAENIEVLPFPKLGFSFDTFIEGAFEIKGDSSTLVTIIRLQEFLVTLTPSIAQKAS